MLGWAFGLAVFGIAAFYLLQWLQMPLYQDEVALRISGARFLVDGATDYGLFGQCKSNVRTIALVFQPVAWLYSAFDAAFGWAWVREVPVAGVLLAFGVVLAQVLANRMFALSLLLPAGLIGVAGSGLVMSRMEAPTLFLGSICFIGYVLIRRPSEASYRGRAILSKGQTNTGPQAFRTSNVAKARRLAMRQRVSRALVGR